MQRVSLSPSRSKLALLSSVLVLLILPLLLSLFFSVFRESPVSSCLSFLLSCVSPPSSPSRGQNSEDAPLSCVSGDAECSSSASSVRASLPTVCFTAIVLLFLFLSRLATWTYARVSLKIRRQQRGRLHRTPPRGERGATKTQRKDANAPIVTIVVLGSGGHTGEMLRLVQSFNPRFFRMHFLVADSDSTSLQQLAAAHWRSFQDGKTVETKELDEETKKAQEPVQGELAEAELKALVAQRGFRVSRVPRSREVGQSFVSSFFSSLRALLSSLRLVWRLDPELVLVNGPGTCIPVAVAALLREFLLGRGFRLIYVESVCRVDSLSLSGRLLYPFADRFFVQWPGLAEKFPKCEYVGRFF